MSAGSLKREDQRPMILFQHMETSNSRGVRDRFHSSEVGRKESLTKDEYTADRRGEQEADRIAKIFFPHTHASIQRAGKSG